MVKDLFIRNEKNSQSGSQTCRSRLRRKSNGSNLTPLGRSFSHDVIPFGSNDPIKILKGSRINYLDSKSEYD